VRVLGNSGHRTRAILIANSYVDAIDERYVWDEG